jgi:hypothetical protein
MNARSQMLAQIILSVEGLSTLVALPQTWSNMQSFVMAFQSCLAGEFFATLAVWPWA